MVRKMKYDKGKVLTGNEIRLHRNFTNNYSFSFGFLARNGEYIMEECIYENEYNEIVNDLTEILKVTDLRIGEEVLSGDEMLEVKEKEWTILKMTDNYGKPYKQIHLTIMFDR